MAVLLTLSDVSKISLLFENTKMHVLGSMHEKNSDFLRKLFEIKTQF